MLTLDQYIADSTAIGMSMDDMMPLELGVPDNNGLMASLLAAGQYEDDNPTHFVVGHIGRERDCISDRAARESGDCIGTLEFEE